MTSRHLIGPRRLFVLAVPVAWGVLLLFHPLGSGSVYEGVKDHVMRWQVVHVGTMLFIALMAAAVLVLLRDVRGRAAALSRFALVPFVAFYTAYEANIGIGTGFLVGHANGLPAGESAVVAETIEAYRGDLLVGDPGILTAVGSVGWIVAVIGAGVALRREGAPRSVAVLLGLSSLVVMHPPPFGPIGLACFVAAVVRLQRMPEPEGHASEETAGSPASRRSPTTRATPSAVG